MQGELVSQQRRTVQGTRRLVLTAGAGVARASCTVLTPEVPGQRPGLRRTWLQGQTRRGRACRASAAVRRQEAHARRPVDEDEERPRPLFPRVLVGEWKFGRRRGETAQGEAEFRGAGEFQQDSRVLGEAFQGEGEGECPQSAAHFP